MARKVVGIVGGVGPYAGLYFNKNIFDYTPASFDQDYFEVIHISASSKIGDRTEYLLNPKNLPNPAYPLYEVIKRLSLAGANLIVIPCNTAHSSPIFEKIVEKINQDELPVKIIHMLKETFAYLKRDYKKVHKLGLLATKGTYQSRVYNQIAEEAGFEIIIPNIEEQSIIHSSIYDKNFGIKAKSSPVSHQAIEILENSSKKLVSLGADAVIMGCTEIPLAIGGLELGFPLFDPMVITAKRIVDLVNDNS